MCTAAAAVTPVACLVGQQPRTRRTARQVALRHQRVRAGEAQRLPVLHEGSRGFTAQVQKALHFCSPEHELLQRCSPLPSEATCLRFGDVPCTVNCLHMGGLHMRALMGAQPRDWRRTCDFITVPRSELKQCSYAKGMESGAAGVVQHAEFLQERLSKMGLQKSGKLSA